MSKLEGFVAIVLGAFVALVVIAIFETPVNEGYPCSVGEPVLSGYTDEKWIDYVDGQGRRALVLDKVPVYECKLPEATS